VSGGDTARIRIDGGSSRQVVLLDPDVGRASVRARGRLVANTSGQARRAGATAPDLAQR
jgi:hypothetical protein